jgi:hypothetical protein
VFTPFILAAVAAALFYLILPAVGAFVVRSSWRSFRSLLLNSVRWPILSYRDVRFTPGQENMAAAQYRVWGGLEAVEGKSGLWIRAEGLEAEAEAEGRGGRLSSNGYSVLIDMGQALIYSLSGSAGKNRSRAAGALRFENAGYDETLGILEPLSWSALPSLSEGARVYVAGRLVRKESQALFQGERGSPLLVIFYEGEEADILGRCVRLGRQPNEYWNQITPIAFALGALSMLVILFSFTAKFVPVIFLLTALMALLPISICLPPGLALLFLYRSSWKKGRYYRACRDSIVAAERRFSQGAPQIVLPNGELYEKRVIKGAAGLPPGIRVRTARVFVPEIRSGAEWACYGTVSKGSEKESLLAPKDPMAEFLAVPNPPEACSRYFSRQAHWYTFISGCAVVFSAVINNVILFIFFRWLLLR